MPIISCLILEYFPLNTWNTLTKSIINLPDFIIWIHPKLAFKSIAVLWLFQKLITFSAEANTMGMAKLNIFLSWLKKELVSYSNQMVANFTWTRYSSHPIHFDSNPNTIYKKRHFLRKCLFCLVANSSTIFMPQSVRSSNQ